jgi:hypothetical protein
MKTMINMYTGIFTVPFLYIDIFARKCYVKEIIDSKIATNFLEVSRFFSLTSSD